MPPTYYNPPEYNYSWGYNGTSSNSASFVDLVPTMEPFINTTVYTASASIAPSQNYSFQFKAHKKMPAMTSQN